jgi:hypothetical protein
MLRTERDEESNGDIYDELRDLIADGEEFFSGILELGLVDLYEDSMLSRNQLKENCWEYFHNEGNLSDIVIEWALISAKNEYSQPFRENCNTKV